MHTHKKAFNDLRQAWQGSYYVTETAGVYTAVPFAEPSLVLAAASVKELRDMIRADYAARHPLSDSGA